MSRSERQLRWSIWTCVENKYQIYWTNPCGDLEEEENDGEEMRRKTNRGRRRNDEIIKKVKKNI